MSEKANSEIKLLCSQEFSFYFLFHSGSLVRVVAPPIVCRTGRGSYLLTCELHSGRSGCPQAFTNNFT